MMCFAEGNMYKIDAPYTIEKERVKEVIEQHVMCIGKALRANTQINEAAQNTYPNEIKIDITIQFKD